MASDATCLRIVDFHRGFWTKQVSLNVEEIDVMSRDVDDGEEQHRVSTLAVEPLRLIQGQESDFRSNESQEIPAHWQQYEQYID